MVQATRSSHRQCLIFWIKESFHLILKKAFRYLVQMAVTDNTDAAIFVASDGSITKLINVCASDVVLSIQAHSKLWKKFKPSMRKSSEA
ncbi:hypothetical protein Bca52824_032438 [Brassica carinata]|uniref:Uncharacterized protein n=1 Tax=Brassica carinata TaxID=52824 RepID=A0A8X7SCI1_BRACI|nr:hypothetical protein Bca52824_032438 [Brassica carinata]